MEKGRMWAAVPAAGGQMEARLTTRPLPCMGKTLYINAVTVKDGQITAELLDDKSRPIKGFTRDDSLPFTGDEKFAELKWQGGETPQIGPASVRFYLKKARLYGFKWR